MKSTVLILPAAEVDTGNAVAEAMGWGPNNYSVALSADGSEPATHFGLHAWTDNDFQQMINTSFYPSQVSEASIDEETFYEMLFVLKSSFQSDYTNHFTEACAEAGLQVIEEQDPFLINIL